MASAFSHEEGLTATTATTATTTAIGFEFGFKLLVHLCLFLLG